MAADLTDAIVAGVTRLVGRDLTSGELELVTAAIAGERAADADELVRFVEDRNPDFANAITTGRYLDAMVRVTKRIGLEKAQAILAHDESSPYFLVSTTPTTMEPYGLEQLTATENPDEDEIIRVVRDLLQRTRATGCAIIISALGHVEDEIEPTTGARRRIDMLFAVVLTRTRRASIMLPLDGGVPVWHDFTAIATGLERYEALSADLAAFPS